MTGQGFSATNVERADAPDDTAAQGTRSRSRTGRILIAVVIFVLLGLQLVVGLRALPNPLWAVAGIAVGLPLTVLILRKPEFGLLLTIALVPLESLASRQNDPLSLFKVFGGLTMVAFLIGWAFQGRYTAIFRLRQNYIVLAIAAVMLVSAIFSKAPELTFTALRRMGTLFVFYFLAVNLIRTPRLLRATAWLIMVPVAASAAVAIASYLMGQNLFPADMGEHKMFRSVGTSRDANFFAATILVGLPFYAYFFRLEQRKIVRAFLAGCFLVTVVAVIYSFSRGGAIALACMLLAMVAGERFRFAARRIAIAAVVLGVVGVLLLLMIPSQYGERLASFKDWREDDSLRRRGLYVVYGGDMVLHRPLTGVGPGAFQEVMESEYNRKLPLRLRASDSSGWGRGRAAHNMYLEIVAELGIPGLLAFGWLFLFTFRELRRLVRVARERGPPEFYAIARSVEIAYWGFLITSLFLSAEYRKYLWLLVALAAVLRILEQSPAGYAAARARGQRGGVPATARSAT